MTQRSVDPEVSAGGVAELPAPRVPLQRADGAASRRAAKKPFVLGFAAPIEGGKSTISIRLAEALRAPRVSFREYLEGVARNRGLPVTRESLQEVGQGLIQRDMRSFCVDVLRQSSWAAETPLLIDGVRHVEVLKTLKELLAPSAFYLIYLNIDRDTQRIRFSHDDLPHNKPLEELESHSTEVQVKTLLRGEADLVLDGTQPVEQLVTEILAFTDHPHKQRDLPGDWDSMNQRRAELIHKRSRGELTREEGIEFEELQRRSHEQMERSFPRPRLTPDELKEVKRALGLTPEAKDE